MLRGKGHGKPTSKGLLKNTPAAEKMVPLVARSNRVDERGRGVDNCGGKNPQSEITRPCLWNCLRNGSENKDPWRGSRLWGLEGRKSKSHPWAFNDIPHLTWHTTPTALFLFALCLKGVSAEISHQPFKWSLIRWEDQHVVKTITTPGSPSFQVTLPELVTFWEYPGMKYAPFYMCPASNSGKGYCNYPGYNFCGCWGCETIALAWTVIEEDKFLKVGRGPPGCVQPAHGNPTIVSHYQPALALAQRISQLPKGWCQYLYFNITRPDDAAWLVGKMWGILLWESGTDRGGRILIKKELVLPEPQIVGPNEVLSKKDSTEKNTWENVEQENDSKVTTESLWKIMQASFNILNKTHPELTEECWLCYNIRPPFYEAIGVATKIRRVNGTNPAGCFWKQNKEISQGITLSSVTDQGRCVGEVPKDKQHLCNITLRKN